MKTKTWINWIVLLGLLVSSFGVIPNTQLVAQAATIVQVKPGGSTSAGCGSSWATACELQTALTSASAGVEIWVKQGTYKPGTNREDTFQLKSGVALYGGFAGTETAREQRDWETNLSVLSGEIGAQDDIYDNVYNVVTGSGVDATAILDGFTVTGGMARGSFEINDRGGGMVNMSGSPSLANVTFHRNSANKGGGIFNDYTSNPILTNVTFSSNYAYHGAGMTNYGGSPSLINVTFTGNIASAGRSDWGGGGMYNWSSSPTLTNVTFSGNSAQFYGGGVYNDHSNPTITNTILWGNAAGTSSPQIYNYNGTPSISYSDVQGGCAAIPGNDCSGGGNIESDPLFVRNPHPGFDGIWGTEDDDYGDLRLMYGSPAIDAGDNTAPGLVGITTDLGGKPRFYDVPGIADTGVGPSPVVDMGAYEKQANDAPAAGDDNYITDEDDSLHIGAPGILANDRDPDGEMLTAVLENGPGSGSLDLNPDGSFNYLPEANFTGDVMFTYHVSDGLLLSNTATVTITVCCKNIAPVAIDDDYMISEDENLSISSPGVLNNDSDQNSDPLSAVLENGPSSGSLNLNPDGSFDFQPKEDFSGMVTYTYRAFDGLLFSNIATVRIFISSQNDSPIAVNDVYATSENAKLTINAPGVLNNDSDPEGNPLIALLMSQPSRGSLNLNQDGSFDYIPPTDFSGVVTFAYCASDNHLESNTATVTITVGKIGRKVYLPMLIR